MLTRKIIILEVLAKGAMSKGARRKVRILKVLTAKTLTMKVWTVKPLVMKLPAEYCSCSGTDRDITSYEGTISEGTKNERCSEGAHCEGPQLLRVKIQTVKMTLGLHTL